MISIKLPRGVWQFDPGRPLGAPGGFGEVFEGAGADGGAVAVKRLKLTAIEAAHRELRIAEQLVAREYAHVLPILDAGQDADSDRYFVVMPRADRSLQDELNQRGTFAEREAVEILQQIAQGLRDVADLVHRDLKPANVLFQNGAWKIADFGIARFVEEATSTDTLKDCLSPPFAAPEQWRSEHATGATDIYALGCIAYALLNGQPPFTGAGFADYRAAHLTAAPPELQARDPRLCSIVAAALRKAPDTRPSLGRVLAVLQNIIAEPEQRADGRAALQHANAVEAERQSQADAKFLAEQAQTQRRQNLARAGWQALGPTIEQLATTASVHASEARVSRKLTCLIHITLGTADLVTGVAATALPEGAMPYSKWDPVNLATINVTQRQNREWSHGAALWYMRLPNHDDYRWYEVSYKRNAILRDALVAPFAQTDVNDADMAAGPGMHVTVIDSGPTPIDDENTDEFVDRWLERLARAHQGRLCPF